ncbi:hypothetical protein [Streptomyces sp. NPDC046939]|uniref:hypothetical protein n=1 Tax=Streptomyces sp. NPDC046939 TaxID=3155376 RepID=UPI0033C2FAD6
MVRALITLTAVALVWLMLRVLHYPGRWEHMFAGRHRRLRHSLAEARATVRALHARRCLAMLRAHHGVLQARSEHRRRIARLEARRDRLRDPDPGPVEDTLGPVVRHAHVLAYDGRRLDLAGLRLHHESDRFASRFYLYITEADGTQHVEPLGDGQGDEERIRQFCVDTHNAAVKEIQLRLHRDDDIRAVEAELAKARSATGAIEQAEEDREATRQQHLNHPRLPRARKTLEEARDAWQERTGHRPLL